jgi:linearmycin/streptolysin S transport system ATP-binding protein
MVCGLLRRDAGEVEVAGRRLDDEPLAVKAAIGLVPQEIALYPDLTGRENLRFFGRLYGLAARRLTERVDCGLDVVGLLDRADERTDSYSGGMKRRLNIAAGLLHEPQLLVLDEPTVGVDPQSRNAILQSVHALGRRAWRSCTRRITWKKHSGYVTGLGSSTRASWSRRAANAGSSSRSASRTA